MIDVLSRMSEHLRTIDDKSSVLVVDTSSKCWLAMVSKVNVLANVGLPSDEG